MANHIGGDLSGAEVTSFANGETNVKILSSIRGTKASFFSVFSFSSPS
jgi:phosphoribosylpyrophosphate synthetase